MKRSSVNKILGEGDHVSARPTNGHDSDQVDLPLQWIQADGHRELLKAVLLHVCAVLHFVEVLVNLLENVPRTTHRHVRDLCVAVEGHKISYITSHGPTAWTRYLMTTVAAGPSFPRSVKREIIVGGTSATWVVEHQLQSSSLSMGNLDRRRISESAK